jgi:hypothetical protein
MSLLEEYIVELEKDVKIDQFNIRDVQMKLPAYKHKWVGRLMRQKQQLNILYAKKAELRNRIGRKIQETSAYKVSKPAADKAADNHESMVDIVSQIDDTKVVVELLEKAERILSSMTYDLKNLIEVMKLEIT